MLRPVADLRSLAESRCTIHSRHRSIRFRALARTFPRLHLPSFAGRPRPFLYVSPPHTPPAPCPCGLNACTRASAQVILPDKLASARAQQIAVLGGEVQRTQNYALPPGLRLRVPGVQLLWWCCARDACLTFFRLLRALHPRSLPYRSPWRRCRHWCSCLRRT